MMGSWIRRAGFWTLDALKGGIIRKHYYDIKGIMESETLNNKQLELLLAHALNTVPFYKDFNNFKNICEFPVLTKNDYKENYDNFKSDLYLNKPLHKMSTSGSTGTPFTVLQNMNKRKRMFADLIYFNEIAGQKLGEKYMYIKVWPKKRSKTESIKQNEVTIDILRLDEKVLNNLQHILKKDRLINSVLAYPSTYEILADYLLKKGDTPDMFYLKVIFSFAALLDKETKKKTSKVFDCPIIDRYANMENGLLAQTPSTYGKFIINRASYYIELLKFDSNESAKIGEVGRIIVTDLYNFAMPIIRYDTGDLAMSNDNYRNNLKAFHNIQGRKIDLIYDTKGNPLTPHTWTVHMRKYSKLRQWQFIQEDKKRYILRVSGEEGIYSMEDFDNTLKAILGTDADIKIQFVDEIPVLSSGKFRTIICNYKPDS